jgi:hypothetical protein
MLAQILRLIDLKKSAYTKNSDKNADLLSIFWDEVIKSLI